MKKTVLRQYAKLIARMGANVQKGQEVFIFSGIEQPEFTAMVAEECYRLKAKKVVVDWEYQPLTGLPLSDGQDPGHRARLRGDPLEALHGKPPHVPHLPDER